MRNIKLLDCTLRDGGYVNNWKFGKDVINKIVRNTIRAGVDVIECGYLSLQDAGDPQVARYNSILDVERAYADSKSEFQEYAVMVNYGEFPVELLDVADEKSPLIRLAFHKKDVNAALEYMSLLKEKKYRFFAQPMGALNYSDEEFVQLVHQVNVLHPHGFYIVDSFGVMELKDFRRLLFLADGNLESDIMLGYHSHNNLQQAYSNSKYMVEQNLEHNIIIDASVFGMGRGAGNLNIELFAEYLNHNFHKHYNIEPILEIFDECLKPIFAEQFWGYSLPFYLSSLHNCHPNYASYFSEKNTLSVKSMHELLASISDDDKVSYSDKKANEYYKKYQEKWINDGECVEYIQNVINNRPIMILAPGKTLKTHESLLQQTIYEEKPIIFGVNNVRKSFLCDFGFVSNEKRTECLSAENIKECIITSNLKNVDQDCYCINYSSYLCSVDLISDNPTLMLINLLVSIGVSRIMLGGFDGYSTNAQDNYYATGMSLGSNAETKLEKNDLIKKEIAKLRDKVELIFVTPSLYE